VSALEAERDDLAFRAAEGDAEARGRLDALEAELLRIRLEAEREQAVERGRRAKIQREREAAAREAGEARQAALAAACGRAREAAATVDRIHSELVGAYAALWKELREIGHGGQAPRAVQALKALIRNDGPRLAAETDERVAWALRMQFGTPDRLKGQPDTVAETFEPLIAKVERGGI